MKYVFDDARNLFEGLDKEEIHTLITQIISGQTIPDLDTGFVTKLKEQNHNTPLKFWIGTQAEYNAIDTPEQNCFYIFSDSDELNDLEELCVQKVDAELNKEWQEWTPTLKCSPPDGGTAVDPRYDLSEITALYKRQGNICFVMLSCVPTIYEAGTGYAYIDGLPLISGQKSGLNLIQMFDCVNVNNSDDLSLVVNKNQSTISLKRTHGTTSVSWAAVSQLDFSPRLEFSGFYIIKEE